MCPTKKIGIEVDFKFETVKYNSLEEYNEAQKAKKELTEKPKKEDKK